MMTTDDKSYLDIISGESKEDRRRRLNRLAKQRSRAKAELLKPASESNAKLGDKLSDDVLHSFQEALNKLNEFVKKGSKVKDIPAINKAIEELPKKAKMIQQVKDCNDLEKKITSVERKNKELNPKKKVPSNNTIHQNMQTLASFYKNYTNKQLDCSDLEWVRDTDRVLSFIDNFPKYKTETTRNRQRSMLASVLRNLEDYKKEYEIYSTLSTDIFANKISKQIGENKLSDSQKKNYMDWDEIINKLNKNTKLSLQDKALTSLYTRIPPRRRDYSIMKVIFKKNKDVTTKYIKDLDRDYNYLILNNSGVPEEIIFYNYKTKDVFGKQNYKLKDKKLIKDLQNYIKDENKNNGDFLFSQSNGKPYKSTFSTLISNTFNSAVKKKLSVNLLRHSYISHILKQGLTLNKRKEIAERMGHSLSIQSTYNVVDDKDDIIDLVGDDKKTKKKKN